jgi:hypothetical protein
LHQNRAKRQRLRQPMNLRTSLAPGPTFPLHLPLNCLV